MALAFFCLLGFVFGFHCFFIGFLWLFNGCFNSLSLCFISFFILFCLFLLIRGSLQLLSALQCEAFSQISFSLPLHNCATIQGFRFSIGILQFSIKRVWIFWLSINVFACCYRLLLDKLQVHRNFYEVLVVAGARSSFRFSDVHILFIFFRHVCCNFRKSRMNVLIFIQTT